MPYCTQCGNAIGDRDTFCGSCGAKQPPGPGATGASAPPPPPYSGGVPPRSGSDFLSGISAHTASLLCYIPVLGWIPSVVVLASQRFRTDRDTRFHAFQGLYLSVAWLIVDWVIKPLSYGLRPAFGPMPVVSLLKAILVGAWIFMLVKISQNQSYKLPFLGDLAEKSVSEQR